MLHEEYKRLGKTKDQRCQSYRALFKNHLDGSDLDLIHKAAHYSQPVGDDRFNKAIEKMYGITLRQSRRGRPSLKEEEVVKI